MTLLHATSTLSSPRPARPPRTTSKRRARVDQRADQHVAGDARERVDPRDTDRAAHDAAPRRDDRPVRDAQPLRRASVAHADLDEPDAAGVREQLSGADVAERRREAGDGDAPDLDAAAPTRAIRGRRAKGWSRGCRSGRCAARGRSRRRPPTVGSNPGSDVRVSRTSPHLREVDPADEVRDDGRPSRRVRGTSSLRFWRCSRSFVSSRTSAAPPRASTTGASTPLSGATNVWPAARNRDNPPLGPDPGVDDAQVDRAARQEGQPPRAA